MKKQILTVFALLSFGIAFAQETTATLSGRTSDEKGIMIRNATISIVHEPTGKITTATSNDRGYFFVPNLLPGGPYTVTINSPGHPEEKYENISLGLGANPDVVVILKNSKSSNEKVIEGVVVRGIRRKMDGMQIGREQLAVLPTLGRSLSDFTRLTPQSNNNSFAGTNFRYNNVTLDGAVNNDAIGFSNSFGGVSGGGQSGTAGSGARSNPYSLDAIQEVSVQIAPYDVKIGNMTGGSVNAVTKSGTNQIHGSIYGYGRTNWMVGKSVDGQKTPMDQMFHDYQYGGSVGGALMKNKAFFFINIEQTDRAEPTFYNAGDPGAAITKTEADKIRTKLATYGYDPGESGVYKIFTKSNKFFGRLDFNLNPSHSLMIRANYVDGRGNNLERTPTNFQFSSTDFTQYDKTFNAVMELKSKFSGNLHNDFLATYTNVHEYRDFPGTLFPFMDIDNGRIWAGTWREASIYNMRQKTFELTDNLTYQTGIHNFTLGTHNEFYNITYGFVNSWNGRWEYGGGLNNFLNDNPSRVRSLYALPGSGLANTRDTIYNNPPAPFKVNMLSAYLQDEISVMKNFKFTPGIRVDYSYLDKQPAQDPNLNSLSTSYIGTTFNHTPFSQFTNQWLGKAVLSPRLSFSYDVNDDRKIIVKGGSGVFVGRMPFAWFGYAYTLNGNIYGNIDYKPGSATLPLVTDPTKLQSAVPAANSTTRELDIIDNSFKLPRVWRSNLGLDLNFGDGYKLALDGMYTMTLYDVQFQQINLQDNVQYFSNGPTQTPVYVKANGSQAVSGKYSNIYLLTNTTQGKRYNLTGTFTKTQNNIAFGSHYLDLNFMAAYTFGKSYDISNGIRNSFQSNFEVNPAITPNNPTLSYSNFDMRHRIVSSLSLAAKWSESNKTSLAFFFSTQSGSPYSLVYQADPFGNTAKAPLAYIPKNQSDINLAAFTDASGISHTAAEQWAALDQFISNDPYLKNRRGMYAERNGMRTPWNTNLDMKIMHQFNFNNAKKQNIQISLDIFNVLNLLNSNWGKINFVTNVNNYAVNFLKFVKDANGNAVGAPSAGYKPTYNFVAPPFNGQYYGPDPMNSRWQAQLGVKFNF